MKKQSECDYCGKLIDYPLPVHPKCAEIWLRGYENAREYYTKKINEINKHTDK